MKIKRVLQPIRYKHDINGNPRMLIIVSIPHKSIDNTIQFGIEDHIINVGYEGKEAYIKPGDLELRTILHYESFTKLHKRLANK